MVLLVDVWVCGRDEPWRSWSDSASSVRVSVSAMSIANQLRLLAGVGRLVDNRRFTVCKQIKHTFSKPQRNNNYKFFSVDGDNIAKGKVCYLPHLCIKKTCFGIFQQGLKDILLNWTNLLAQYLYFDLSTAFVNEDYQMEASSLFLFWSVFP